MKASTFTLFIFILILTCSCQKNKVFKINEVWKKIDVKTNPIDNESEIWDMKNGNLVLYSKLKDNKYEKLSGGKYHLKSNLGSTVLIVENCPLNKYSGQWDVIKLNAEFMVISRKSLDGLQYLEFEIAK